MAYTYDQLVKAYKAVHDGIAPDAATQATFQVQATLSANGQISDAQLLSNIINSADNSTALAVLSYQFFTGKTPTAAGMDYLLNSAANTNDLNDAYYSKFSLENRYINFAANLGVQGEGAASFASKYGSLSFADYVASIYQTIIGGSYAQAAGIDPAAAIASIISRKDAILATAQSAGMIPANATAAQIDLALKAATAGYLMGEAIKADVGLYAAAANNFMAALATGTAVYNTNLTYTYAPSVSSFSHGTGKAVDAAPTTLPSTPTTTPTTPAVSHSFALTSGVDHITATAQDDTFSATNTTLTAGDTLNGGGGNDTLNITTSGGFTIPNMTVSNIETVNVTSTGNLTWYANTNGSNVWTGMTAVNLTVTAGGINVQNSNSATTDFVATITSAGTNSAYIYGGHNVSVAVTGATTGDVEVDTASGDIVLTRTNVGAGSHGQLHVDGYSLGDAGATIKLTTIADLTGIANGDTQTAGAVAVGAGPTTTSVEIVNPTPVTANGSTVGVALGVIIVNDFNSGYGGGRLGSITTVKIDGFSPGLNIITDNALTNLTLAHGSGTIEIDNTNAAAGRATTLNLNVNALSGVTLLEDATVYTTLNVTTGATASTLSDLQMGALTTLNVGGTGSLTLTSIAGASSLHTLNVTGLASVTAPLAGGDHLGISAHAGAAAFTGTMGAMATGATFADLLNSAAQGDGHATSQWGWFQYNGATYIVLDSNASSSFQASTDVVVKLVGAFNESGATITNGVLTIQ